MKKTFGRGLLLATCLLMALGLLAGPVMAAPVAPAGYPGLFYGTASVDDEPVDAGTEITAWVGTEQVGSALTGEGTLDPEQYTLTVELEAADVSFKIGERDALVNGNPTIPFKQYVPVEANLTAYTEVTLVSIAVTPESASILVGETQQFVAMGTYSDYSTGDVTTEAVWTSSDIAVATVTVDGGLATGLALGAATITATLNDISGSASLEVATITLVSIAVTPESASILVGETQQFTAMGTYSDDSTADITAEAVWTSSDTAVVTVDGGLATGVALGAATITATLDGISGSAALRVVAVLVTVELVAGVNIIPYTGVTTSLPEALTTIGPDGLNVADVIWARGAWTDGEWLYYNPRVPFGTLTQLENGRAYIIVVSQDCTWELP